MRKIRWRLQHPFRLKPNAGWRNLGVLDKINGKIKHTCYHLQKG